MFDLARSLESAARSSETHMVTPPSFNAAVLPADKALPDCDPTVNPSNLSTASSFQGGQKCFFCGYQRHPHSKFPARDATCSKCRKKGLFKKVCRSGAPPQSEGRTSTAMWRPTLTTISAEVPQSLTKSTTMVSVDGFEATALIDSGSSESFIHPGLVKSAALHVYPSSGTISMATSSLATNVSGYCLVGLVFGGRTYSRVRLSVLPELCADLILGLDFQTQHERVIFEYGDPTSSLSICGLSTLNISPPQLFSNLTDDCHPIATKSRKYSHEDSLFITTETRRLLKEGIIEPSKSPWRAQVVVAKGDNHKRRMVVDYSQTINRFTLLDASLFHA